ncbi:maleylpyruvate isomerase family mycothiol-dependent enzyme [Isoptericola sp. NEAU-Y5]|uniref:Maleylpyruvate isomerase family mycothiol-dependent enzyme n=1 Tax=Isoptericola luteus TaxID=2879484 RepID=A0ABS7ZLX2_9MICO|nr:maleylpyruvate isomerase family mycothiol-dependent enzyme [Isoptericola sp. NEAU-Y5]MCA5894874.1 maleylpyruvate isomerase family mycothiol-dependent enzyme [Isoptericola sp. NEAU-Y5]
MPAERITPRPRPVVDPRSGRRTDGGPEPDLPALLARLQEAFAAAVPGAAPDARVPACGDWRVRELVTHLAGVHHWAAGMAVGDPSRSEELPEPEGGPAGLAALYRRHAGDLRTTLATAGPDQQARTLLGVGPASFWWRRQVHETLVHLHDLHAARLGSGPAALAARLGVGVAPEVWADCVDEVVTMFAPRQVRLGRTAPLTVPLRVVAADLGWSWTLGEGPAPAATLTAPAHGLALLLWGRLEPAEAGAVVTGDAAAAERALAGPLVP